MKKYLYLLIILLGSASCSPKQGYDEVGRNITLLDLFYGMTGGVEGDCSYRGTCCILDSIPGVIRYEDFGEWREPDEQRWYESSLILYVDETFPSVAIARKLAIHADSVLNDYFYCGSTPLPDNMRTGKDFVGFFRSRFVEADSVMGLKNEDKDSLEVFYPYRLAVVICRIYKTTYILETSVDGNGSCGCPSDAIYITYDSNGIPLKFEDIFIKGSENRVNGLLNERFDKEYEKKNGQKPEPHDPYNLVGDNCAIVKEGVLFYYPPYQLGCGAEGQYNLILEYDEIEDLLKENISHGSE